MFGKKQQEEKIGPSKGLMKWINKFFRFVLYPFIHPLAFLFLLLIAAAIVLIPWQIYKVELADIPQWYGKIFNIGYKKTSGWIEPLKNKVVDKYNDVTEDAISKAEEAKVKEAEDIVDYSVEPQVERPSFKGEEDNTVSQEKEQTEEENIYESDKDDTKVEQSLSLPQVQSETEQNSEVREIVKNDIKITYKQDNTLGLSYLNVPQEINGRFTVINADDILVGKYEISLYGISTLAQKKNETSGYLMSNFDGKNIDCYIVAYDAARKAKAICFDGNMNINLGLVDRGYSQNVSLY